MNEKTVCLTAQQIQSIGGLARILTEQEFMVYSVILSHARNSRTLITDGCSQKVIAEEAGCGVRSVRGYIQKFQDLGLIRKWRGPRGTNYYKFMPATLEGGADATERDAPERRHLSRRSEAGNKIREKSDTSDEASSLEACHDEKEGTAQEGLPIHQSDTGTDGKVRPIAESPKAPASPESACVRDSATIRKSNETPAPATGSSQESPEVESANALVALGIDPDIRQVVNDVVSGKCKRSHPTAQFLEFTGGLSYEPQKDQNGSSARIDWNMLNIYLNENNANSMERFSVLLRNFRKSRSLHSDTGSELPFKEPISLHLHRRLDQHLLGQMWLGEQGALVTKDGDGTRIAEKHIQANLQRFMREHGFRSLDELIALAKEEHEKRVAAIRDAKVIDRGPFTMTAQGNADERGNAPHEKEQGDHEVMALPCQEIMINHLDPDRHSNDAVFCAPEETALYLYCSRKFGREYGHLTAEQEGLVRNMTINGMMELGRKDPRLVGFVPNLKHTQVDECR